MKKDKKIIAFVLCLLLFLQYDYANAQTKSVKMGYLGGEENNIGLANPHYKGITGGMFIMTASVKKRKQGESFYVELTTHDIEMTKVYAYQWNKPGLAIKTCHYGEIREIPHTLFSTQLGEDVFEQVRHTAIANFDLNISIIHKQGPASNAIIKNVGKYGTFVSTKISRDFDIESIHISKKKTNHFYINEAPIEFAIHNYVEKVNEIAEAQCKKDEEDKKAKELSDLEDEQADLAQEQEFAMVKEKITRSKNSGTTNTAKNDEDAFWNGGEDKTPAPVIDYNGVTSEEDDKRNVLYLKNSNGDIIKEFSKDVYTVIYPIDKDGQFFELYSHKMSYRFFYIIDKKGNIISIDGENEFSTVVSREDGGYTVTIVNSESLYTNSIFNGDRSPETLFSSSSEAIAKVKDIITKKEEERERVRKNADPSKRTILIGGDTNYNVFKVKIITTDSKMQSLISKSGYIIK